jgi:hypothetical protein
MTSLMSGLMGGQDKPCWHCRFYDGMTNENTSALCNHPGCSRVRSTPANGCSAFEREPGADDEPMPKAE